MAQYLLLIRNEGSPFANYSEEQKAEHMALWGQWMGKLTEQGKMDGGLPLSADSAAVISNGGAAVDMGHHEGPKQENVGGYIFLIADSLEEAIELAKGCPAFEDPSSTVEVRECMSMTVPAE